MVLGDIKNGLNPPMKIPKKLKSAPQPRKQHHDPIFDMIFGQGDKSRKEAASRQLALEESKHNLLNRAERNVQYAPFTHDQL